MLWRGLIDAGDLTGQRLDGKSKTTARQSMRKNVTATVSPHPHPFQCGVQLGFPEPHCPADFEVGDQSGHAPAIEVAFADPEVGAGVFFGEERGGGLFGARRIGWRVHACVGRVNHFLTEWVATNGDNQIATAVPVGNMALKSDGK